LIFVFPRFYRSVQDGNQKSSILNLKSLGIKKPAPFLVAGCRNRFALAFVQLVSAGNRFNGPPPMWWWCQFQAWPWTLVRNIVKRLYRTSPRIVKLSFWFLAAEPVCLTGWPQEF